MTFIWATILTLGLLIFIHELGHYLASRSVGVRVERFSIGIPPRFISMISEDNGWLFRIYFYKWVDGRLNWCPIVEKIINRPGKIGSNTEYVLALIPIGGYVKWRGLSMKAWIPTFLMNPMNSCQSHYGQNCGL